MTDITQFPEIETKNLVLRRMNYKDIDDLFEMRNDNRMNEYTDTKIDVTRDETRAYICKMNKGIDDNRWIIWAIEYRQSGKVIGSISIWNINKERESGELGYGIIPGFQGRGLAHESLLNVVKYGFNTMNLKILEAYTEENNIRSINLLKKCNFVEANRVDDKGYNNDRIYHMIVYRLKNSNQK